jgi:hypothetical protein
MYEPKRQGTYHKKNPPPPHLQLEISIENVTFNYKLFFMIILDFKTKKSILTNHAQHTIKHENHIVMYGHNLANLIKKCL